MGPARAGPITRLLLRALYERAVAMRVHSGPGRVEHGVEDVVDEVDVLTCGNKRRRELHDRVAAVVRAADQAGVIQALREEAAKQELRLLLVERLLAVLVLDQLQRV